MNGKFCKLWLCLRCLKIAGKIFKSFSSNLQTFLTQLNVQWQIEIKDRRRFFHNFSLLLPSISFSPLLCKKRLKKTQQKLNLESSMSAKISEEVKKIINDQVIFKNLLYIFLNSFVVPFRRGRKFLMIFIQRKGNS